MIYSQKQFIYKKNIYFLNIFVPKTGLFLVVNLNTWYQSMIVGIFLYIKIEKSDCFKLSIFITGRLL